MEIFQVAQYDLAESIAVGLQNFFEDSFKVLIVRGLSHESVSNTANACSPEIYIHPGYRVCTLVTECSCAMAVGIFLIQ